MRMVLTAVLVASGVALSPPASGEPEGNCPPVCNRIPESAWIAPTDIPLASVYAWPKLAGLAVTARSPRLRFEEVCAIPPLPGDPRNYAVAERAVVSNPTGQWQLQAQVVHWRGDTWLGGELAQGTFAAAVQGLRDCQSGNPAASASLVVDQPDRFAAVISGPVVVHQYLVADPVNSTITELALWSDSPVETPWPSVTDTAVLDAMSAPLCTAYIDSCT